MIVECPWDATSPPKIASSCGRNWTPWLHGPTRVLKPNGISIGSAVFAGLTSVSDRHTDRPTDHATRSITTGRTYVRIVGLLRCGLKTNNRLLFLERQSTRKQIYRLRSAPGSLQGKTLTRCNSVRPTLRQHRAIWQCS